MAILSRHSALCLCLIIGLGTTNAFAQATSSGIDTPPTPPGGVAELPFSIGGTRQMTLTPNGLGIGTATPTASLDVNGSVHFANGSVNGKLGIGTNQPIGTLDIENGKGTATLCLNGQCASTVGASCGHIASGATCEDYLYATGGTGVCGGFNMTWETIEYYRCDNGNLTLLGQTTGYGFCSTHTAHTNEEMNTCE